jgi:acyl carrier protein
MRMERGRWARMQLVDKVKEIVAQQLDVDIAKITPEARFIEDLGADSLAVVEIVLAFEGEFNIDIPDEVTKDMATIGDVIAYVEQHARA